VVQRLTVQMCRAATVQEFLERFEIGKILGVGGAPPLPNFADQDRALGRHPLICCCRLLGGQERKEQADWPGSRHQGAQLCLILTAARCAFGLLLSAIQSLQVVEKARYEQGDNSLLREIEILCKVGGNATARPAFPW